MYMLTISLSTRDWLTYIRSVILTPALTLLQSGKHFHRQAGPGSGVQKRESGFEYIQHFYWVSRGLLHLIMVLFHTFQQRRYRTSRFILVSKICQTLQWRFITNENGQSSSKQHFLYLFLCCIAPITAIIIIWTKMTHSTPTLYCLFSQQFLIKLSIMGTLNTVLA